MAEISGRRQNMNRLTGCFVPAQVGLRGYGDPVYTKTFSHLGCVYFDRHASMVVHSNNCSLLDAFRRGEALITSLDGEVWTRLQGDRFE